MAASEAIATSREWMLNAECEYRFELDQGTSLAIKVSDPFCTQGFL